MLTATRESDTLDVTFTAERARLIRLCAHLTGDPDAAEDLAQETLYTAVRNAHTLRNPAAHTHWLSGIARNLCRQWVQQRGRERTHVVSGGLHGDVAPASAAEPVDAFDVEIALEREELVSLLDQALALLPADTRQVLIQRFVDGSPHGEIAARLGLSEGAVRTKLHRGKLVLRRVLTTTLADQAAAFELVDVAAATWQETHIWCPGCGRRRLMGRFDKARPDGRFQLRCPDCYPDLHGSFSNIHIGQGPFRALLAEVRTFKPALNRITDWVYDAYTQGLREHALPCMICSRRIPLRLHLPATVPLHTHDTHGLHLRCDTCGVVWENVLSGLLLSLPAARHFWHEHPRIRTLPARMLEAAGHPAIVTTFESLTESARLDVVTARDTFHLLGVYPITGAGGGGD